MNAAIAETKNMIPALVMLARIINQAGREKATTAAACPVIPVPAALLEQARDLMESYRDLDIDSVKHASKRVFN